MPKKLLEDMVAARPHKKEPVPEPEFKPIAQKSLKVNTREKEYDEDLRRLNMRSRRTPEGKNRYGLWFVAFVSVVFLFFAFSSLLARAKVVIDPKVKEPALHHNFTAVKDSPDDDTLSFSVVSLSLDETRVLDATEEKEAKEPAKGRVVLYNNYSTSPQKLSKDTRLLGTNKKIYKTETEVVIPPLTKADPAKNTKENIPGSIEVNIYASENGEEYNSPPLDFQILGFMGTPKGTGFYGRSKGDITGGLKGHLNFVSTEEKAKAYTELNVSLENSLRDKLVAEIPEGYILFTHSTVFKNDYTDASLSSKDKQIPFVLHGTMYGILFKEESITKAIVKKLLVDYDGSEVYISNLQDLDISIPLLVDPSSYLSLTNIDFTLTGTPRIVWKVDENKLKAALLSKQKKEFNDVLTTFKGVSKGNLIVRPFWETSLPSKSKDIKIIVNY
jgi:hypothetical protein